MNYGKLPPKIIKYRDYKKFSNGDFLNSVKEVFSNKSPNEKSCGIDFCLLSTCLKVLNKHVPCKKKVHRKQSDTFHEQLIIKYVGDELLDTLEIRNVL